MDKFTGLALTLTAAGFFAAAPAAGQSGSTPPPAGQQGSRTAGSQPGSPAAGHSGRHSAGTTAGSASTSGASQGSMAGAAQLSPAGRRFLINAAQGSMAEIEMGKLAQERGSGSEVKQLGQKLEQDHTKALEQARSIAQSKGVTIPQGLSPKDQALHRRLSALSGAEFDRAFMKEARQDHKKDLAEFRKYAGRAKDPDLKQFAESQIPVLEEHERMAMQGTASSAGPRTDTEETAAGKSKKKSGKKPKDSSSTNDQSMPDGSSTGSAANPR